DTRVERGFKLQCKSAARIEGVVAISIAVVNAPAVHQDLGNAIRCVGLNGGAVTADRIADVTRKRDARLPDSDVPWIGLWRNGLHVEPNHVSVLTPALGGGSPVVGPASHDIPYTRRLRKGEPVRDVRGAASRRDSAVHDAHDEPAARIPGAPERFDAEGRGDAVGSSRGL